MKAPLRSPVPALNEAQALAQIKTQLEAQINALRQEVAVLKAEVAAIRQSRG
jgi:uncharacterized protein YceH (UPF0502 family)